VKYGSLYSRGKYVLFLDADGATHYTEIAKIYKVAKAEADKHPKRLACIIGSRNTGESEV
jgi:hypothetical protein